MSRKDNVVLSVGAMLALTSANASAADLVARHMAGDAGLFGNGQQEVSEWAGYAESKAYSAFLLCTGDVVWVVSEAERGVTSLLTPEEY